MATNDITNDRLTTGHVSEDYRSGYDGIFGKAREKAVPSYESEYLARSRAIIRDYWECPEEMWERLDELSAEYGKD